MDKAAWWSMGSQGVAMDSSDLARRDSRLHLGLLCHPAFLSCLQLLILPHTQAFTNTILLAQHFQFSPSRCSQLTLSWLLPEIAAFDLKLLKFMTETSKSI